MREAGPGWGGSMKSSRLTSRQLPQSAEMRLNSDSIQSAAALTPVPGGRSVSMLEMVLRLLKVTSLAMMALMLSGETCWRAAAMAGSAGAGAMGWPVGSGCCAWETGPDSTGLDSSEIIRANLLTRANERSPKATKILLIGKQ